MRRNDAINCLIAIALALLIAGIVGATPPQSTLHARPPQCTLCVVVAKKTTTQTVFATRAPRGHTHTCANGHTWDHDANPTHKCQYCGAVQYVQDRSPRPVTVTRTVVNAPVQSAPAPRAVQQTAAFYFLPRLSAGGCANGQCAVAR